MNLDAVADHHASLRIENRTEPAVSDELRPTTLEDGYRVQDRLVKRLCAHYGGEPVGWKVACTNEHAQALLNTDAPLFARLVSSRVHDSPAELPGDYYDMRVLEPEFGFVMTSDVPPSDTPWTRESIKVHIGDMVPAIEIVGHRFGDWSAFDAPLLVADNAISGGWVKGAPRSDWRDLDLAAHAVTLKVDGEVVREGSGHNVLGHPLEVVAWLANELGARGKTLSAGDWVTTGTCTNIYEAKPGERIVVDFGGLGECVLRFGG